MSQLRASSEWDWGPRLPHCSPLYVRTTTCWIFYFSLSDLTGDLLTYQWHTPHIFLLPFLFFIHQLLSSPLFSFPPTNSNSRNSDPRGQTAGSPPPSSLRFVPPWKAFSSQQDFSPFFPRRVSSSFFFVQGGFLLPGTFFFSSMRAI